MKIKKATTLCFALLFLFSSTACTIQRHTTAIATVQRINDIPRLFINGQLSTANMFFVNGDIDAREIYQDEIRKMPESLNHMYSTNYNINYKENPDQEECYYYLKYRLDTILQADPEAKILLRISITTRDYPGASNETTETGTEYYTSLASDLWFHDAIMRTKKTVEFIRNHPTYAAAVYGYHLDHVEWYSRSGIDCCPEMLEKFTEWRNERYQENSGITVLPPSDSQQTDYSDFFNELTAIRIEELAKVIKDTSNNENIVTAFYGYYLSLPDRNSGHLCMKRLLDSPYIDGFSSPVSYSDRYATEAACCAYMGATGTVINAGKLWISESDIRTYLGANDGLGPLQSIDAICSSLQKQIGMSMIYQTSMYPMELLGTGWYNDKSVLDCYGDLNSFYLHYIKTVQQPSKIEVAFVIDESAMRSNIYKHPSHSDTLIAAHSAGISFTLIEMNDLLEGKANDYKAYFFLTPWRLSEEEITVLQDILHKDHKLSVFMNRFGQLSIEEITRLTGITEFDPKRETVAKMGNYTTFFFPFETLNDVDITYLLEEYSTAHIFCDSQENLCANDTFIMINARNNKTKTIHLPKNCDVYDYFSKTWYTNTDTVQLSLTTGQTAWLFYGEKEQIQKIISG